MSLTDKAYFERMWGFYPTLAKHISNRKLSIRWVGATTASSNVFDEIEKIIKIYALVTDYSEEIRVNKITMSNEERDSLVRELDQLARNICFTSSKLNSFAEDIKKIRDSFIS